MTGSHVDQLLHPRIDPAVLTRHDAAGDGAGGLAGRGGRQGRCSMRTRRRSRGITAARAARCILVRDETNPDDVHGMLAAQGVLTARGGKTSHAAVVARGFGIPCVAGAEAIRVNAEAKTVNASATIVIKEGDTITMDGSTGERLPGRAEADRAGSERRISAS